MNLSIGFITARTEPKFNWLFDSLLRQIQSEDKIEIIIVDTFADQECRGEQLWHDSILSDLQGQISISHCLPKPTVWQGKHRLTKEDRWAKANSLNTFICLAQHSFVAMVDDRACLGHAWRDRVNAAMEGGYVVCGYYEKHSGLKVENGLVVDSDELLGADIRTPGHYPFSTTYGGHCALPLEWCLAVNGYPEVCDGLGLEDSLFGNTLRNAGYPIHYDSDMRIFEDRTPGQIDGALKRADKNPHLGQQAKSWALVRMMEGQKTSLNQFDIRNMRDRVLNGEPFPIPSGPTHDFYDQQPLSEME